MEKTRNEREAVCKERQAGFTLVELIAVLVILGILAMAALPKFSGAQEKAKERVLVGAVGQLNAQLAMAFSNNRLKGGTPGAYDGFTGVVGNGFDVSGQALNTPAGGTIKLTDQAVIYTLNWQAGTDNIPGRFSLGAKL